MKTLEEFLEDQCGMVTPNLLEIFEPHRAFVEDALKNFWTYKDESWSIYKDWDKFSTTMWKYLPEPKKDHF